MPSLLYLWRLCILHLFLKHKIIQHFLSCDIAGTKMQLGAHLLAPNASCGCVTNAGLPNVKGKYSFQQGHWRSWRLCLWAQKVKLSRSPSFPTQNGTFKLLFGKSLLTLPSRVVNFCYNGKFSASPPLGKDIRPGN